jgi:hypothetical protein
MREPATADSGTHGWILKRGVVSVNPSADRSVCATDISSCLLPIFCGAGTLACQASFLLKDQTGVPAPRRGACAPKGYLRHCENGFRCIEARPVIQARPANLANHQRRPTKRNRQSLKNSGGLPSIACPTNCRIHPTVNMATGATQSPRTTIEARKSGIERAMSGMPIVCRSRFAGCWWLFAYRPIQSSQVRPPSISATLARRYGAGRAPGGSDRASHLEGAGFSLR